MLYLERDNKKVIKELLCKKIIFQNDDKTASDFIRFLNRNIDGFTKYIQPDLFYYDETTNECTIIDFLPFSCHTLNEEKEKCYVRFQASLVHKERNFEKYFARIKKKLSNNPKFRVVLVVEDFSNSFDGKLITKDLLQKGIEIAKEYCSASYIIYRLSNDLIINCLSQFLDS